MKIIWIISLSILLASCGYEVVKKNEVLQDNKPIPTGRFVLIDTKNFWNFILLDTWTGRLWQCQFTVESTEEKQKKPEDRPFTGCVSLDTFDKSSSL